MAKNNIDPRTLAQAPTDTVGLGVDIVEIDRMKAIIERTPSFVEKVFSEEERAYCSSRQNPAAHFASRFAAKEAVVKALGIGFSEGVGVRDIEVKLTSKGRPYPVLTGKAKQIATDMGVLETHLSLSYSRSEAVACALIVTRDSLAAQLSRIDPTEQLAKQFKEARALLDMSEEELKKAEEQTISDMVDDE
ncbi:MAG: holo-ACP synthase [Eggerthellaceae bacterium]|nr:holo-ACP synthase [Eggerthellaceae bacterium]